MPIDDDTPVKKLWNALDLFKFFDQVGLYCRLLALVANLEWYYVRCKKKTFL